MDENEVDQGNSGAANHSLAVELGPVAETAKPVADAVQAVANVAAVLPQAVVDPIGAALADIVAWFETHVPNSIISRDTIAHNRIYTAVSEIKSALGNIKE